jgi:chemotaxis protein histidine kinase CheA
MLAIRLRDDGRGLALEKIRQKASSVGLIHASRTLDDEEAAQLVFSSGLSTANAVTDVSGRGVGMEAALEFIKAEHGSIEIRFTDDCKGAPFRHFETVILLPASVSERVDGLHGDGASGARHAPLANPAASAGADPTNAVGSRA